METKELIEKLAASKLFYDIPIDEVEEIVTADIGRLMEYKKGETLINAGETWNSIDVILTGTISVSRLRSDGEESTVQKLRENGIIGMEFMRKPDYGSQFYYIARTDVEIYSIHKWYFMDYRQLGEKVSFQMLKNLISVLSHENVRQHRRLDALSGKDLKEKLLVYLYYEKQKQKTAEIIIPFNREELATYLCVNRSALSREISHLEEEGILRSIGKRFFLEK